MTRKRYIKLLTALGHILYKEGKLNNKIGKMLRESNQIKIPQTERIATYEKCWKRLYKAFDLGKYGLPNK